jgi:hypothetical protein
MSFVVRVSQTSGVVAALFLAVTVPNDPAHAEQTSSSQFAPVTTPGFDVNALKTPRAPAPTEVGKLKNDRQAASPSGFELPKGMDVGSYKLDFNANHTTAVTAPHMNMDSGETANLSNMAPGKRNESVLPNYFGFKLSAPTH